MNGFHKAMIGFAATGLLMGAPDRTAAQSTETAEQAGQGVDDPQNDDIFVQGQTEEALQALLESVLAEARDGQMARFATPICPRALGFPAAYAPTIEQRIRRDAKKAGLKTGSANCTGNLIVVISDDPKAFLNYAEKKVNGIFDALTRVERAALFDSSGPSWAWQAVEVVDSFGQPPDIDGRYKMRGSRLGMEGRQNFSLSFIVIDVNAIDGMTLQQLADFAAMRTLAKIRDEATQSRRTDSILGLFTLPDGSRPDEITRADLAMLRALYATSPSLSAKQQRSAMADRISGERAEEGAGEE